VCVCIHKGIEDSTRGVMTHALQQVYFFPGDITYFVTCTPSKSYRLRGDITSFLPICEDLLRY